MKFEKQPPSPYDYDQMTQHPDLGGEQIGQPLRPGQAHPADGIFDVEAQGLVHRLTPWSVRRSRTRFVR